MFNKIIKLILCIICLSLLTISCKTKGDSSLSTIVKSTDEAIYLYYSVKLDKTPVICRYICQETPNANNIHSKCIVNKYIPFKTLYEKFEKKSVDSFKVLLDTDFLVDRREPEYIFADFTTEGETLPRLTTKDVNKLFSEIEIEYKPSTNPKLVCKDPSLRSYISW